MEHDFRITTTFPYRDRNRNRGRNHILNPYLEPELANSFFLGSGGRALVVLENLDWIVQI